MINCCQRSSLSKQWFPKNVYQHNSCTDKKEMEKDQKGNIGGLDLMVLMRCRKSILAAAWKGERNPLQISVNGEKLRKGKGKKKGLECRI